MRRAGHAGEHVRLVDFGVGLGRAVHVECFGRLPPLDEQEDLRVRLRVVDLESQAAGLHPREAALFLEPVAEGRDVFLVVGGEQHVGVDHADVSLAGG